MAPLGRQAANEKAGVEIAGHTPKTPEAIPKSQKIIVPVFNVVGITYLSTSAKFSD
jgi:hypothetical protein